MLVFDQNSCERVFKTNPFTAERCPFDLKNETVVHEQSISVENWLGLWYKHFNKNAKMAFRDLYYAGYCGQMKDAIVPVHSRPRDVNGVPSFRKSFNVQVIGPSDCGKSSFLRKFIDLPDDSE